MVLQPARNYGMKVKVPLGHYQNVNQVFPLNPKKLGLVNLVKIRSVTAAIMLMWTFDICFLNKCLHWQLASDIKSQEPTFKVWSKQDLGLKCSAWKHFGFGLVGLEYKTKTVLRLEIRFLAPPSSGDRVKCILGVGASYSSVLASMVKGPVLLTSDYCLKLSVTIRYIGLSDFIGRYLVLILSLVTCILRHTSEDSNLIEEE